jgi:hypothetical protein
VVSTTQPTDCPYCRDKTKHVYDMHCAECRSRIVKRASDINGRRSELRKQALAVVEMAQGSGAAALTAKETEGDPRL